MSVNTIKIEVGEAAENFLDAFANLELDRFCAAFAPEATVFMPFADVPRRLNGIDEIKATFAAFFDQVRSVSDGPPYLNLQPQELDIQLVEGAALVTFHLNQPAHFSRRSVLFEKRQGTWLLVHLHASNFPKEN